MATIWLVKATPYDPGASAETTVYYSTGRSTPGAAPVYDPGGGAVLWPARVTTPLNTSVSVFTGEFGGAVPTFGVLEIDLEDGDQDPLLGYYWDGRDVWVYRGEETDAFASFALVLKGTVKSIQWTREKVTLNLSDFSDVVNKPVQTTLYAGTGGAEGGTDLTGKPKPLSFGKPRNVEPTLISAAYLVYQFHGRAAQGVDAVYDQAVPLTAGADYASYADLTAATVAAGGYATCLAEGLFRLGGMPVGPITADVQGDNTGGFAQTAGGILKRIAVDFTDLGSGDLDTAAFTALDTANAAACSRYISSQETPSASQIFDELMKSVGAFWTFTPARLLTVRQVAFGTSKLTISDSIGPLALAAVARLESPPPYWLRKMGWARCWRVQAENEIAGAAGVAMAVKPNFKSFADAADGEAMVLGVDASGAATDSDGIYAYGGQMITVTRAQFADGATIHTSQTGNGYIVHDTDPLSDVFRDLFVGVSNTNLQSHTPSVGTSWTKASGTPGLVLDGSGHVKATGTTTNPTYYTTSPAPGSPDYSVEVQIDAWATTAGKNVYLLGRYVNTSNSYFLKIGPSISGISEIRLYKCVASTLTSWVTAVANISPVAGQKFRLKMVGTTLSIWTKTPSDAAWTQLGSTTDSSFGSTGLAGLAQGGAFGFSGGTDITWLVSNFAVTVPVSPLTVDGEHPAVVFVRFSGGNWQYDDGSAWTNFTPAASQLIVGTLSRGSSRIEAGAVALPQPMGVDDTTTLYTRGQFVREAYRFDVASDTAIQTRHKLARDAEVESLLDSAADAATENARQLALLGVKRDPYQVPVQRAVVDANGLVPGDTVTLKLGRFALSGGKDMIIGGIATGQDPDETVLTLWG